MNVVALFVIVVSIIPVYIAHEARAARKSRGLDRGRRPQRSDVAASARRAA